MSDIKKIAVLPGDGIGPEVCREAVKVMNAVCERFGHKFEYEYGLVGAAAIDETGDPYPIKTHELCTQSDAILFGAIGDPKYDNNPNAKVRPEQGLLRMRKSLGLYANIRPVTAYEALLSSSPLKHERISGTDLVIFRELTGGIYFGKPSGRSENDQEAFDASLYSREEIRRIAVKAFEAARKRRNKVTLVDKANVLATSRLWRDEVTELHKSDYSDVQLEFLFVDNAAMQLILNPSGFDVVLTENMFGDILSDEASVIGGSLGLLPSASIGDKSALYEPVHGSYPQATGKDIANPVATILSAAMLLETSFDMIEEANTIREAVNDSLNKKVGTEDLFSDNPHSTTEVGYFISDFILQRETI
ncbi:3-isopropylmalate dehydrogenase [Marinigracilibium pacificum]|uniref:3-isopropylmalate dehydrogenase n=1 Tax=Marinigracilibium pacificum TaxID=2729599 RepID=A0A848IZA9_9BACT|nr:3-isopropylmalate dehydrogenase [Marinigracilibium pacificum]NMM49617.1 3-isopropylmalate dehydrogenase [Marinigracilibium pacificum]